MDPSDQTCKQQIPSEMGTTGGNANETGQLRWKIPGECWATGEEMRAARSGGVTPACGSLRLGWGLSSYFAGFLPKPHTHHGPTPTMDVGGRVQ